MAKAEILFKVIRKWEGGYWYRRYQIPSERIQQLHSA